MVCQLGSWRVFLLIVLLKINSIPQILWSWTEMWSLTENLKFYLQSSSCLNQYIVYALSFFYCTGITKAASKLSLRQQVRQQEASPAVKQSATTTVSSYSSNGQIHSQYHGYHVKATLKIQPPEEPIGDLHPSDLVHLLPSPVKQIQPPAPKPLPAPIPSQVPAKDGTKAQEPPKEPQKKESSRSRSLAETKRASMEMDPEIVEDKSVSWVATHIFII